jgi:hypothetical protein
MSGTYGQLTSQLSTSSSSTSSTPPSSSTSSTPPSTLSSSSTSTSLSSSSSSSTPPSSSSKPTLAPSGLSDEVLSVLKKRIDAYCSEEKHDIGEGKAIIANAIQVDLGVLNNSKQFENRLIQHARRLGYTFPLGFSADDQTEFTFAKEPETSEKLMCFQFNPTIITRHHARDLIALFKERYPKANCRRGKNPVSPASPVLTFNLVGFFKYILPDIAQGAAPTATTTLTTTDPEKKISHSSDPLASYLAHFWLASLFVSAQEAAKKKKEASNTLSPRIGNGAGSA